MAHKRDVLVIGDLETRYFLKPYELAMQNAGYRTIGISKDEIDPEALLTYYALFIYAFGDVYSELIDGWVKAGIKLPKIVYWYIPGVDYVPRQKVLLFGCNKLPSYLVSLLARCS